MILKLLLIAAIFAFCVWFAWAATSDYKVGRGNA
jgi:hypothetical protein